MKERRTIPQNSALHLYAKLLAQLLDGAGYDMRTLIQIPIQPTTENVKENIIRPIRTAMWPEIKSTRELDKEKISLLYECVNRATAEKLGISIAFPSKERDEP